MKPVRAFLNRIRRALRRDDGTASIEFVILFPVFVTVLISSMEMGVLLTRQAMLERALDIAVRDLRLGRAAQQLGLDLGEDEELTRDDIRQLICGYSPMISRCDENLIIELTRVDVTLVGTENWAGFAGRATCVERGASVQPATAFVQGTTNELMLIRGCALVDPIFPTSGFALNLPRDSTGAFAFVAQSVFVNEPR